jgi:glycosyltransferase involved in cell wall biosynthesis
MAKTNSFGHKLKVCYVLSYRAPDYTRTATLVAALRTLPNVELTVIKNRSAGVARYWQTFAQLVKHRFHSKPDVFILGFRGQEVFGLFYPLMRGRPIIFDEFINHHDWIVDEHSKFGPFGKALVSVLDTYMRWVVRRCAYVLEDTPAHADLSRAMYHAPAEKIVSIPVGAEETLFKPQPAKKKAAKADKFEVFFYGNMLPLHGFDVILDAIKKLGRDGKLTGMHFTLVGGKGKPAMMELVETFIAEHSLGDFVTHLPWVEYQKIPDYVAQADVCLGGPFGGTGQARRVITGKTYQFMAMGAPVIIGDTENANLFHDKHDCLIVEQKNPTALAEALLWCQSHPEELRGIGQNGHALYENEFSVAVIAWRLDNLLDSLPGKS